MTTPEDSPVTRAVEGRIRAEHAAFVDAVDAAATRVAEGWDGDHAHDRRDVVGPLRQELESAGWLARSTDVLADAVEETGYELPADPVAAPPYVVVTSYGLVLRATIEPGRLVIRFAAFDVGPSREARYRPRNGVDVSVSLE